MITASQLADIALEIEARDQIDWGELAIDEHEAFKLMAMHVLDMDNCPLTNKAVIVKLLVENFVLNLKLLGRL